MKQKPKIVQQDAVPVDVLVVHQGKNPATNEPITVMTVRYWRDNIPHNLVCALTDTNAARVAIDIFKQLPKETVKAVAKELE